jgi:hypothetical protein
VDLSVTDLAIKKQNMKTISTVEKHLQDIIKVTQFWIKNKIFGELPENIDLAKLKESLLEHMKVVQDYLSEKQAGIDEINEAEVVNYLKFNDLKVIDDDGVGKVVNIPE